MVEIIEKTKPKSSYSFPFNITDEMRQFTKRREQRAGELGIALYILGEPPEKDIELQQLEDYIMENYIDMDLDVPEDIKQKYLSLKNEREHTTNNS